MKNHANFFYSPLLLPTYSKNPESNIIIFFSIFFEQLTTLASLALADPHYGYGYGLYGPGIAGHPGYATSYTYRSPQGIGKRSAEPEPHYGGYLYGPGIAAHPGYATSYTQRSPQGIGKRSAEPEPHLYGQYAWPSVSGPYFTSTCFGCRGKRSADAEPEADAHYGYAGYGYGLPGYSYASFGTPYGHYLGKRSADADAHGLINNVNRVSGLSPFPSYTSAWPGAHVMVNHFGKRSADAHMGVIDNVNRVSGLSPFPSYTSAWPGAHVMVNHMGKRSADAEPEADAWGVAGHPYGGTSYVGRTVWGFPSMHHYGKRSADADPHMMPMTGIAMHPGGATSYVGRTVWGFPVGK